MSAQAEFNRKVLEALEELTFLARYGRPEPHAETRLRETLEDVNRLADAIARPLPLYTCLCNRRERHYFGAPCSCGACNGDDRK